MKFIGKHLTRCIADIAEGARDLDEVLYIKVEENLDTLELRTLYLRAEKGGIWDLRRRQDYRQVLTNLMTVNKLVQVQKTGKKDTSYMDFDGRWYQVAEVDNRNIFTAQKLGRLEDAAQKDHGLFVHALTTNPGYGAKNIASLCNTRPGSRSIGWVHDPDIEVVTCERCCRKLREPAQWGMAVFGI